MASKTSLDAVQHMTRITSLDSDHGVAEAVNKSAIMEGPLLRKMEESNDHAHRSSWSGTSMMRRADE